MGTLLFDRLVDVKIDGLLVNWITINVREKMAAASRLPFSYRYFLSILWNRSDLSEDLHRGSVHPHNWDHGLSVSSIFQRCFRPRSSATNRKNKKMRNNVRNKKTDNGEKETFDPFVIYILDVQLLIRANGGRWLSTKSRNNSNYLQDRATFSNRSELRAATRSNEINRYHPFHFDQLLEFLPSNQRSRLFFSEFYMLSEYSLV